MSNDAHELPQPTREEYMRAIDDVVVRRPGRSVMRAIISSDPVLLAASTRLATAVPIHSTVAEKLAFGMAVDRRAHELALKRDDTEPPAASTSEERPPEP